MTEPVESEATVESEAGSAFESGAGSAVGAGAGSAVGAGAGSAVGAGAGSGSDAEARAVGALEERLARATEAAERMLAETAVPAGPPPSGWQRRGESAGQERERFGGWLGGEDAELLLSLLSGLRDRIPLDLQERLAGALRELLLALRALIDWCVERAERRRAEPAEVQDIPIL